MYDVVAPAARSILVQVHPHGGDARQFQRCAGDLQPVDGMGAGRQRVALIHTIRMSIRADQQRATRVRASGALSPPGGDISQIRVV